MKWPARPAWLTNGKSFFVHAAFHTLCGAMSRQPPSARWTAAEPRAVRRDHRPPQPDGFPERLLRWVNHIPAGLKVYCGTTSAAATAVPGSRTAIAAASRCSWIPGRGKGGHLSWIDL
ncbi:MAG: hypothetical protein WDN04_27175 [Rhodospirillales bacterium]